MSRIDMVKNRLEGMFLHDRTGIDETTVQMFECELRELLERYFTLEKFECSVSPLDLYAEMRVNTIVKSRRIK